jgi:hypothetical protein
MNPAEAIALLGTLPADARVTVRMWARKEDRSFGTRRQVAEAAWTAGSRIAGEIWDVPETRIKLRDHTWRVCEARHAVLHTMLGMGLSSCMVARAADRTHGAVLHSKQRADDLVDVDPAYAQRLALLKATLITEIPLSEIP